MYEGYPEYAWYPHAKKGLEQLGFDVTVPQMPEPNKPKLDNWIKTLKALIKKPNEHVYLIGHSIGAVTILRYLENMTDKDVIGGVILVAPLTDDMGYEVFQNFFLKPLRLADIKTKAKLFTVIVSDNDPYVDMKYGYEISQALEAELIIKHGMKHMSQGCYELSDIVTVINKKQKEREKYE